MNVLNILKTYNFWLKRWKICTFKQIKHLNWTQKRYAWSWNTHAVKDFSKSTEFLGPRKKIGPSNAAQICTHKLKYRHAYSNTPNKSYTNINIAIHAYIYIYIYIYIFMCIYINIHAYSIEIWIVILVSIYPNLASVNASGGRMGKLFWKLLNF